MAARFWPSVRQSGACAALVTVALAAILPRDVQASDSPEPDGGASMFEDGSSLLTSYSSTVGVLTEIGSGELSGWKHDHSLKPTAYGVRYFDRNGFVTGTTAAIAIAVAGAAAASGPKSSSTTYHRGYKVTRYPYYSPAEKAAMAAATSAAAASVLGAQHQSFDLQIYSRNLGVNSNGWRVTMMFGGQKPFSQTTRIDCRKNNCIGAGMAF